MLFYYYYYNMYEKINLNHMQKQVKVVQKYESVTFLHIFKVYFYPLADEI